MIQVLSGSSPSSIAAGTTYTNLLGGLRETLPTIPVGDVVPVGCRLRNIFFRLSAAPGTSESRTFTVLVNEIATAAVVTIANADTFGMYVGADLILQTGDYVHLQCDESAGAMTAGFSRYGYEIETVGTTTCVFFGNSAAALNSYPMKFGGVLNQIAKWDRDIDGGPYDEINVMPIDGIVSGYRLRLKRGLPVGFLSGTFTIYKSTDIGATWVAQDGTGGTPDTRLILSGAATESQDSASFSLLVQRGDLLYMQWDCVDADGAQWGCSMATLFTSSVAGQWPYCGEPSTLSGSTTSYNAIFAPHSFGWSGTDGGRQMSEGGVNNFSLAKFILYLHDSPGTGDTRIFETYLDGTPQDLAITLSNSDQLGEDVIHRVPVAFGDTFGIKATATGSPVTSKISWGYVIGQPPVIGPYMVHHFPRETP